MKQGVFNRMPAFMLLPLLLLGGCGDDETPVRVQESPKTERLFDTQRSALEQAKEAADSATLHNLRFQERKKELD